MAMTMANVPKTRILLVTMVKNESRIIHRLMGSVSPWIDGYVICDTGSTDNTVELAIQFLKDSNKVGAVVHVPWVNFGVSRTASVAEAVKWVASMSAKEGSDWSPKTTWGLLLDGDMILPDAVDKNALTTCPCDAILLNQKNNRLIYKNTRILRLDREWKCVGATHEYWDTGNNKLSLETPVIQDLNDGGCKSDKFTRDAALLEKELEANPRHDRTLFYLGQTYQSLGKKKESNDMLMRRIDVGGWPEEIYMARIYRGDNFMSMGEAEKAVDEWLEAWQVLQNRTEAAIRLIQHYRKKNKSQFIAMMFLEKLLTLQRGESLTGRPIGKPLVNDSILFVSHPDMEKTIWEEFGILAYYTTPLAKRGAWAHLDEQILLSRHDWGTRNHLLDYMRWYDVPLKTRTTRKLKLDADSAPWSKEADKHIWEAFNPSIRTRPDGSGYQLVLRHGNYSTTNAKHFPYRGREGFIVTRNVLCGLTKDLQFDASVEPKELVVPASAILHPNHHIQGIEDCRLIQGTSMPLALATGRQLTTAPTNKISCVMWNEESFQLSTAQMKLPAGVSEGDCQKNWLPFMIGSKPHYVFHVSPFTICDFEGTRTTTWQPSAESGWTLDGLRGSAAPVPFGGEWLMVVHYSQYSDGGRRYYHRFMTLDEDLRPLKMSCSFRLGERNIEYVSGLTRSVDGTGYVVTYGVNDSEAYVAEVGADVIQSMLCYDLRTGLTDRVMLADYVESQGI